jgi:hypothetical protein
MDTKMLHLEAPEKTLSLKILAEMCGAEMVAVFSRVWNPEEVDPILQFARVQDSMRQRQVFILYCYGQRMCQIDMVGEYLPAAVATARFERGLRLAILDARFSAGIANDIGQHLTTAQCVAANPKVSAPTVRAHIKLLEDSGLVSFITDPVDQRRKLIFPTREFIRRYYIHILTKMCIQYGLVFDSDRLPAAAFETRWLRDFDFDGEVLQYARDLVKILYPSSRVIHVDAKEKLAVI